MNDLIDLNTGRGAHFSDCRQHRCCLWRIWDPSLDRVMVIGLNPSTGNEDADDPTITRLTKVLKHLGFGGFYMLNLFTVISSKPKKIFDCPEPSKYADIWLKLIYKDWAHHVVFAWGNFDVKGRDKQVMKMFSGAWCFGKNKNGTPKHPFAGQRHGLPVEAETLIPFA